MNSKKKKHKKIKFKNPYKKMSIPLILTSIILLTQKQTNSLFQDPSETISIRFAFSLSRTGAHSPSKVTYNENSENNKNYIDIFNNSWNGENELTNVGKRQQFLLGYRHYITYIDTFNNLLNKTYDPREIYASSSESNRTIQSAYAQLHGLYQEGTLLTDSQIPFSDPPNNKEFFQEEKESLGLNTLPNNILVTPVHTFYEKDHSFLLEKKENCPLGYKVIENIEKSDRVMNIRKEFVEKYGKKILSLVKIKKDGTHDINLEYLINNGDFFKSCIETFICNYFEDNNLINEEIKTEEEVNEILNKIYSYMSEISLYNPNNINDNTKKFVTMVNIPLITQLISWLKKKVEKDIKGEDKYTNYDVPKFISYSSHHYSLDSLNAFMNYTFNLKNKNIKYPQFTSFINIHLIYNKSKERKNDDYNVTYSFDEEELLNMKYIDFIKELENVIKIDNNTKKYCNYTDNDIQIDNGFNKYIVLTIIFGVIFVILIVILIHFIMNKRTKIDRLLE